MIYFVRTTQLGGNLKNLLILGLIALSFNSFACKDMVICGDAFGNLVSQCLGSKGFNADKLNREIKNIAPIEKTRKVLEKRESCESIEEIAVMDFRLNFKNGIKGKRKFICETLLACE